MIAKKRKTNNMAVNGNRVAAASSQAPHALCDIGMIELLEQDGRPTFVLDLEKVADRDNIHLQPVFCNASLRSANLQDIVTGKAVANSHLSPYEPNKYSDFKGWASSRPRHNSLIDGYFPDLSYNGLLWNCATIRKKWRIVSGSRVSHVLSSATADERELPLTVAGSASVKTQTTEDRNAREHQKVDFSLGRTPQQSWTDILPPSEYTDLFRAINWSQTPLGPLSSWSPHLRQMTCFLMADSRPASMFWGSQRAILYNEPYIMVIQKKHPKALGMTFNRVWAETVEAVEPAFVIAEAEGRATTMQDSIFFLERYGYLEETFFTWNLIPLRNQKGDTEGFYNSVSESTRQKLSDRRTATLISTVTASDMSSFWHESLNGFESNELDIPLAVSYSLETESESGKMSGSAMCVFQAALGISEDHPSVPKRVNLEQSNEGFIPLFRKARFAGGPMVLQKADGNLPEDLLQGIQWRGFGEPSSTVIVLPLAAGEEVLGFLLLGLNPRRAYDEDFERFIQLLSRQLSTSLTTAALIEQARLNQANLARQLSIRTQEVADSESRFKAMTELNPLGMFYISPEGIILYANERWYEMSGHPKELNSEMSFMGAVFEDDIATMEKQWHKLTVLKMNCTFELRLRKRWYHADSKTWKNVWILATANPVLNEDGSPKSVMGCITDISLQKQAQEDALERATLSEQITRITQEANENEKKFKQMAELSPCGMFYYSPEGLLIWANSQYYDMTGNSRDPKDQYTKSFYSATAEEDHALLDREFHKITVEKKQVRFEFRTKRPWINTMSGKPVKETAWLLCEAFPVLDEDGSVKDIMGTTTDISHLKWAESLQMRSRIAAEEARASLERFIDITSHEMRNPLSAILQSADGIASSLIEFQSSSKTHVILEELVESNLEAIQIITLCAQHQGRIINDVLTLSKLDSAMLLVSPVTLQPSTVVKNTLKMFGGELASNDIKLEFRIEESYTRFKIDWVLIDPSRMTQAIKFTRSESERTITVSLAASVDKPPKGEGVEIEWFPSRGSDTKRDLTLDPEWGKGEQVYLYFAVKDTGRGLTYEEKMRLFHRFAQANPRTHVEYGGSGLGLFISRELTELQGGEIGLASKAGKGSTFAFFIRGRRATASIDETKQKGAIGIKGRPRVTSLTDETTKSSVATDTPSLSMAVGNQIKENAPMFEILLVEDNLVNQKVLGKQLQKAGCTVSVANHGEEALDFLTKTKFWKGNADGKNLDIVLMDLEMPVMDGLTCARRIRELQQEGSLVKHVPLIAVTANARMEQIDISMAAGMDDVMPKPFRISELIPKMEKLMSEQ
ncbi:MAG: hypothetical protein Q9187_004467 [Circinaria calcarea]